MADIVKLKKKAADLEAKKQTDKALEVYVSIVDAYEAGDEDQPDIALYNRVGDMLHKAGRGSEALAIWEKAVDRYTEGGFYNPAIALCNKILRQAPGRTVVYYKLGKIHAVKGFKADARQNFLEYASRQQKAGNLDEAFRALKEFADLVPGQHDVRITLAEQLVKADRKDEAVDQLQLGYSQAKADDEDEAAERIAAKLKEIDPSIEPEAKQTGASDGDGGLVFLDIDDGAPPPRRPSGRASKADIKRVTKAVAGLELLEPIATEPPKAAPAEPSAPGLIVETTDLGASAPPPQESVIGLEATNLAEDVPAAEAAELPRDQDASAASPVADLPLIELNEPVEDLQLIEPEPTISLEPTDLSVTHDAAPTAEVELLDVEAASVDGLELLVEHSGEVDAPVFDVSSPTADLPLIDSGEVPAAEEQEGVVAPAASVSPLDALREAVAANPSDWTARRTLAEALLEHGQRAEGIAELEQVMAGFEAGGDLDSAGSVADEIVRLEPEAIRSHQKRVEYAFRANNRAKLATAYLELADALLADGQAPKARTVYQRVLDITPDNLRAQAAIESIPAEEAPAQPAPRRSTVAAVRPSAPSQRTANDTPATDDDGYVSLGDWLREDDERKSTRMVVQEQEPTGDEQADFSDMLRKFKQGVAENVDEEDYEAHYDLGVAYKEMGLVDEAIAEFQKAVRGTDQRVRAFEALGNCFVEKGQMPVAATILQRALAEPGVRDESLVGVLYILGTIAEEQQQFADAKRYYERVFAVDIQFRDIGDRLNTVEQRLS